MAEHINLTQIIKTLPEKSGVYQYFNGDGIIIYVGKAKNIKKELVVTLPILINQEK